MEKAYVTDVYDLCESALVIHNVLNMRIVIVTLGLS